MGFEDNNEAQGFEGEQLDLDGGTDLTMGTGRTRAQRKKGVKTEEHTFTAPRRDRFGRRGDGEEAGTGADMLNPDKPTRIAGGFSRREMTPQEVKPLQSENSKFSYLFSEDEEDEDEVSTVEGKKSAVEALAMKGDEAEAGNVFRKETRSVIHSQGRPQRRSEPEQAEPTSQTLDTPQSSGRFSRRSEQTEKPAASRFSRRSAVTEPEAVPQHEETAPEAVPVAEAADPITHSEYTEPVTESETAEQNEAEQNSDSTVYAENQPYGYGNPYMYGQYPQGYSPYGAYPQPNPYGQPPYVQPYQSYGQPPYPYQYPAGYPQPQYIPVGYVFQAGFVPVEMTHNAAPRRRKRPSAARSAHRYDQNPEFPHSEQPQEAHKVRAIAAKSESAPVESVNSIQSEISTQQEHTDTAVKMSEESAYESQYERIAAEIPQISEPAAPAPEETTPAVTESNAPARFARRGTVASDNERGESTAPSRFSARGSRPSAADTTANDGNNHTDKPSSSGGRFNRRG